MSEPFPRPIPPLSAANISLRALAVTDAPAIYSYARDPEMARYTLWPAHQSEAFTRAFLARLTSPVVSSWAISLDVTGEAVGMVFLHSLNVQHRKAELAFNVARAHWGRGVATVAATAVRDYAFLELKLHRLEATCMPRNVASRRVLEKIGMKAEGVMRRSHQRWDGFHDMELFAQLSDDPPTSPAAAS